MINLILANLYLIIIPIAVIIALTIILIFFIANSKKKKIKVNKEFIDSLVLALGGIDNLTGVGVENSRLKLSVTDLSLVDLNKIKEFSDKGVFVTGNTIKTLFKYESEKIAYELKKII